MALPIVHSFPRLTAVPHHPPLGPSVRFGSETQPSPDILYASDIDNTFLPWKDGKYNLEIHPQPFEALKATVLKFQDRFLMSFVSGRGLSAIKVLADYFKEIPIRFLALDNGKQLFENHLKLPADQWLRQLSAADNDKDWEKELKTEAKWDSKVLIQTTLQTLNEKGFREVSPDQRPAIAMETDHVFEATVPAYPNPILNAFNTVFSKVYNTLSSKPIASGPVSVKAIVNPDETVLYLLTENPATDPVAKRWGQHLTQNLIKKLNKNGYPIKAQTSKHPEYFYFFYEPKIKEVNKASVIDFILSKKYPEALAKGIQGVFTFGDSQNDVAMLQRRNFTGPNQRQIPAYPTLSGTDLAEEKTLKNHPRLQISQQQGALSSAVLSNLAKVPVPVIGQ